VQARRAVDWGGEEDAGAEDDDARGTWSVERTRRPLTATTCLMHTLSLARTAASPVPSCPSLLSPHAHTSPSPLNPTLNPTPTPAPNQQPSLPVPPPSTSLGALRRANLH
jgi:hypothetical protein